MGLVYVNSKGQLVSEDDPDVAVQYADDDPRVAHLIKGKRGMTEPTEPADESAPKPQAARKK